MGDEPRSEKVSYKQDRLGNERRELDELRAQDGMRGSQGGIVNIETADIDSEKVVYELPPDADRVFLTEVHSHNRSDTDGTFDVHEADLDDEGAITDSSRRSVPIQVSSGATRIHSYSGEEFTSDAIAIESAFEGHFGLALVVDHEEASEPASEQTVAP